MTLLLVETESANYKPRALPDAGEVWLFVSTGMLYEMRERDRSRSYRSCHRIGAPEMRYGCDPTVFCACWDSAVSEGRWVRVHNCPPPSNEAPK